MDFRLWILGADAGAASTIALALERAAFFFGHAAPDAGVLTSFQGPLQAIIGDRAAVAHQLCLRHLGQRWAGVANWEKQFWIFVAADCFVAPIRRSVYSLWLQSGE